MGCSVEAAVVWQFTDKMARRPALWFTERSNSRPCTSWLYSQVAMDLRGRAASRSLSAIGVSGDGNELERDRHGKDLFVARSGDQTHRGRFLRYPVSRQ